MSFENIAIQQVAEYWNRRPCNIRHSTKELGTREYFDEVEARKYKVEPHIPSFADFARWKGKRVLEVGCGIGTDTTNFARAGAQVTAVDLSAESMAVAKRRVEVFGLADRVRFFNGNAEELDRLLPAGETYDLIYSFGVLHHTPHPDQAFAKLRSFLAPGGELRVMVYNKFSWKVLWILLSYGKGRFWDLDRLIATHSEAQTGCPVTYAYSRRTGRELLERHGFKVTEVFADHIFPYRIPDYVQYRYVKEWYFRWMPESLFRRLERAFGWHLCLIAEGT
ncbi:class I SAM-dependent methyltransferase [Azospirillum sp. RWY-5-1]|uniref:Class I SAM-dependent methyltransferase n=1 Tax=Azospirillum oleiclasticum TaxID=2735135 RepID=A0ABX2TN05_9PROT|nr:class I SAM-dependent methyltransferase [Azospirillum oleiclasticum]NYZ17908.1 class I SAM-dependent methyltransferase [Azospirillum oleiclasticum]NYZ25117.1 class I SAM-dependent methyltransferase [Azospirillum oleiclasticum]